MTLILYVLIFAVAHVFSVEGAASLPTCLAGLNPGDRLPQDLGTVCAGEVEIIIEGKGIIGTIPESIGDLSDLRTLEFDSNSLTGGIPSSIGKLENLTSFIVDNDVGGRIPQQLWALDHLTVLGLRSSSISGSIPTTTLGLAALSTLTLVGSNVTGDLPAVLAQLTALRFLDVTDNLFTGDIAQMQDALCAIDARVRADILPGNSFTGVITNQCMYTQNIVPTSSFTASPTSSPTSPAPSMFATLRDSTAALVLALFLATWQV